MSIFSKFNDIVEGWRNHLIPPKKLRQKIEQVSQERLQICRQCPHNSLNVKAAGGWVIRPDEHCTECGCTLSAKTKCLHCACPLNKWLALLSEEESLKIEESIK